MNMTHPDIINAERTGYPRDTEGPVPTYSNIHREKRDRAIVGLFRACREARGLTRQQAAWRNGLTASYYTRIENGESGSDYTISMLADFFGI